MSQMVESPYLEGGFEWLRGNLHAHTTLTDGQLSPEEVIAAYEALGYEFLAISDHDLLVDPARYQGLTAMTLIPADEITRNGPHLLAVEIERVVEPERDRQATIDATREQGGFAILNHPNWQEQYSHFPQELMERLSGYLGIEIYNGVIERLEGSAHAVDRWDRLLSTGRRLWGFAHDDFHVPGDLGRGWNVVQARDRSAREICAALREGRFYASTGVAIEEIRAEGGTLTIRAPGAQRIRLIGAWGRELAYVDAAEASFSCGDENEPYVRIECHGAGVRCAWTQPFWLGNAG
jgi:hypothetical protein